MTNNVVRIAQLRLQKLKADPEPSALGAFQARVLAAHAERPCAARAAIISMAASMLYVDVSQTYAAIHVLVEKGLLTEPHGTGKRRQKRKPGTVRTITPEGRQALQQAKDYYLALAQHLATVTG